MADFYRWVFNENKTDPNNIKDLYKLGQLTSEVLAKRFTLEEINDFIEWDLQKLHDPFLLNGIKEAVDLIKNSIINKEKITIYGDYDVDGITSTAILYKTLKEIGANVNFYIPERLTEGYGINEDAIKNLVFNGTNLMITVDCGISSINEVSLGKSLGLKIIITDHHSVPEKIPSADVVINPHIIQQYPFKDLAGVGVTFKLVQALIGDKAFNFLDIVSIGTIADIVPLKGENRIIVINGLKELNKTKNKGLEALIKVSGIDNIEIDEFHVGFVLAPRLNAAGRLKDASICVNLLINENESEVLEIANYLNQENIKRQKIEKDILEDAVRIIENQVDLKRDRVIVLSKNEWHSGVIGIVASRITEKYYRPVILISNTDGLGKGSGRSIEGFNLFNALEYCKEYLIKFGGHEMAAGLTIEENKIDLFRKKINEYANKQLKDIDLIPRLKIDSNVKDLAIDISVAKELNLLKPFGSGNNRPLFLFNNLKVTKAYLIGDKSHIKIFAQKGNNTYEMIYFGGGRFINKIKEGSLIDVVGTIDINVWNANTSVVIYIKDIRTKYKLDKYYKNIIKVLNKDRNFSFTKLHYTTIIDKRGIKDKYNYILELLSFEYKVAIIVNTIENLNSLIKFVKNKKIQNITFCSEYYKGNKIIVFSPEIKKDIIEYDNIVFLDIPFDISSFKNILLSNKKIHLLFNKLDLNYSKKAIENIIPNKNDFALIYKSIKDDDTTFLYKDNIFNNINLNSVKSLYCLKAMKELGLINAEESDNIFMVRKNFIKGKVDLKKAETMKEIHLLREDFLTFAELLVNQKIKEDLK